MRIILLTDVPGTGLAGEIKEVKNGYARNFLIPKSLAAPATHDQVQRIKTIQATAEVRRLKEEQDMRALAEHLAKLPVNLTAKAGPTGRFYGAITSMQVAEELSRITEREIDRRAIQMGEPIHEAGSYQLEIRLSPTVSAAIQVQVTAAGQPQEAAAAGQPTAEATVVEPEAVAEEPTVEQEETAQDS